MFERYTEKARRTIFFARYEASQFGSSHIETEHLLLGILREDKAMASRLLGEHAVVEAIRQEVERHKPQREKVSTSVDMPLSHECKRVLAYGAEECARFGQKHIDNSHLLLGLLREEKCFAAQLLSQRGLTLGSVREDVRQSDPALSGKSPSFAPLDQWLAEREARGGIRTVQHKGTTTHFAIYAGNPSKGNETTSSSQIPILCIEMIRRDERFAHVQKRCDDHIAEGVPQIWLLDPESKHAYTATKTEGLREFKCEILRISEPPLEMDLARIFG